MLEHKEYRNEDIIFLKVNGSQRMSYIKDLSYKEKWFCLCFGTLEGQPCV